MTPQTKIYQLYLSLLKKYGTPKNCWEKWCKREKTSGEREEIVLGAILTQRTNWRNVELALRNLKKMRALSIGDVYQIGKQNIGLLENLIRPSGFYRQKAKRLCRFCEFITEDYKTLKKFFSQELRTCRQQLLGLPGIGRETADSILLYAGDKPIFVIDEYTRRFVKKHNIGDQSSYGELQQLFQQNLPQDIKVYQDFHALIVLECRGTDWDLVSKI